MRASMFKRTLMALVFCAMASRASPDENNKANPCNGDRNSPATWERISILPVKFINYRDGKLIAHFSSQQMFQQLEFKLPEELKNAFFKLEDEWEEEIDRKEFLKKYKKDYWMVAYISEGEENTLCQANQFKNWGGIYASYGKDPTNLRKSPDTVAYWYDTKITPANFHNLVDEKAFWLFLAPFDGPLNLDREYIPVEDGREMSKVLISADGLLLQVLGHGVFKINGNTVFHTVETKEPRTIGLPGVSITSVTFGKIKTRVKPVDQAYFKESVRKSQWLCFFSKDTQLLLRAVEFPVPAKNNGKNNGQKNSEKNKNGNNSRKNN